MRISRRVPSRGVQDVENVDDGRHLIEMQPPSQQYLMP